MKVSTDSIKYLEHLGRSDLAVLIKHSEFDLQRGAVDNGWFTEDRYQLVVRSPQPTADALASLSEADRKRIATALVATESLDRTLSAPTDYQSVTMLGDVSAGERLVADLIVIRETMIDVATGGKRIQDVEDDYRVRHVRSVDAARATGVQYDNPHGGLWDFYEHWRVGLPSYADRRRYVRNLLSPAIETASKLATSSIPLREPTGWERVDRALSSARARFDLATNEEDFQAIGLLCREVLISVAQAVFDPTQHKTEDGVDPSATDAKRMLAAFLHSTVPGESFKEVRAHARASVDLSLNLQHRRTATRQLAALCLEATSSTAEVIAIISGRERG